MFVNSQKLLFNSQIVTSGLIHKLPTYFPGELSLKPTFKLSFITKAKHILTLNNMQN